MKIKTGATPDVTETNLNRTLATRESVAPAGSDSTQRAPAPVADSIALSTTRNLVQVALAAQSDVRAARVSELQKQVASGQYQVDARAVSQALIAAHFTAQ